MTDPKKKAPSVVRETAHLPTAWPMVSASLFKATCLELMDDVAKRQAPLIVTKHGKPMVKVGPADDTPSSPIGFLRGTVIVHDDIVSPDHAAWAMSDSDPLGGVAW